MPFSEDDITQIRMLIRDELRDAAVSVYEWRSSDKLKTEVTFQPGNARMVYDVALAPDLLDQIASALAERFSARFR